MMKCKHPGTKLKSSTQVAETLMTRAEMGRLKLPPSGHPARKERNSVFSARHSKGGYGECWAQLYFGFENPPTGS
jgi:hypothetical protein